MAGDEAAEYTAVRTAQVGPRPRGPGHRQAGDHIAISLGPLTGASALQAIDFVFINNDYAVCDVCAAVVPENGMRKHTKWHCDMNAQAILHVADRLREIEGDLEESS